MARILALSLYGSEVLWLGMGLLVVVMTLNDSELETMAQDAGLGLWLASPPLERPGDLMEAVAGEEP